MKRLLALFTTILYLASCTPQVQEYEPDVWEFPEPEGLFVFHEMSSRGEMLFGLIDGAGEVALPFQYSHISVLQPLGLIGSATELIGEERFFRALSLDDVMDDDYDEMYSLYPGWALISPQGRLLTGFYYDYIGLMPGQPTQIIARRSDNPEHFVFLSQYGREDYIEDEEIIYTLTKHYSNILPREEWWRFGPDIPDYGFEWTMDTRTGNFWGLAAAAPDTVHEQGLPEIRLYNADGVLLNDNVYHMIEYIGEGMYMGVVHGERVSESFIVNYNGRRLAGPYEFFYYHPDALPLLLGISQGYANVLTTNGFRELHSIAIPLGGRIDLVPMGLQSFVVVSSKTQPLTITMLGSGEEIVFEGFENYSLSGQAEDLSRFILWYMNGREDPGQAVVLIDRQGNILASGFSFSPQMGYIVARIYDEYDRERYALLDWDGNILLPAMFEQLEVLPGNALLATREGRTGITDLGGNWIFWHE